MAESRSLFSRLAIAIVLGFLFVHGAMHVYYAHERMVANTEIFARSVIDRVVAIQGLVDHAPDDETSLLARLSNDEFSLARRDRPTSFDNQWTHANDITEALETYAAGRTDRGVVVAFPGRTGRVQVAIEDGAHWLEVSAHTTAMVWGWDITWSTLLLIVVLAIVLWTTLEASPTCPSSLKRRAA